MSPLTFDVNNVAYYHEIPCTHKSVHVTDTLHLVSWWTLSLLKSANYCTFTPGIDTAQLLYHDLLLLYGGSDVFQRQWYSSQFFLSFTEPVISDAEQWPPEPEVMSSDSLFVNQSKTESLYLFQKCPLFFLFFFITCELVSRNFALLSTGAFRALSHRQAQSQKGSVDLSTNRFVHLLENFVNVCTVEACKQWRGFTFFSLWVF